MKRLIQVVWVITLLNEDLLNQEATGYTTIGTLMLHFMYLKQETGIDIYDEIEKSISKPTKYARLGSNSSG